MVDDRLVSLWRMRGKEVGIKTDREGKDGGGRGWKSAKGNLNGHKAGNGADTAKGIPTVTRHSLTLPIWFVWSGKLMNKSDESDT